MVYIPADANFRPTLTSHFRSTLPSAATMESTLQHSHAVPSATAGAMQPIPGSPPSDDELPKGDGSGWTAEQERIVMGPYEYMIQHPGKDIRKQLIQAFNAWLRVPEDRLTIIAKAITMLHNASLLYVFLILKRYRLKDGAGLTTSRTRRCFAAASPSRIACLAWHRR